MGNEQFIIELMNMGLTRQEAIIYCKLLECGKQTGYEIAKATGISRSNAYTTLSALVDKGAAYLIEESAKRYIPVAVEEFCDNYLHKIEKAKDWLLLNQPQIKQDEEGYITIDGLEHILNKAKTLVANLESRVYITGKPEFLNLLRPDLENAVNAKKKVVIVTDASFVLKGAKIYVSDDHGSQVGVIADSKFTLTGEWGNGSTNTCLYSGQKNLVTLFKNALANEIKLISIRRNIKR
ncbi:MAG: helix-turn-helix domain-containing protein [Hespellia sp.]|nr:helix-turn-helix domain-containing protein [Hespellia sp.]